MKPLLGRFQEMFHGVSDRAPVLDWANTSQPRLHTLRPRGAEKLLGMPVSGGVALMVVWALVFMPTLADAQDNTPRDGVWSPNGPIYAIANTPDATYIGGSFSYIGPDTGSFVRIGGSTGELAEGLPKVVGTVRACAPDGTGGWYIGGDIVSVGGQLRNGLAHVLHDGSVDPAWRPSIQESGFGGAGGEVQAIAVSGTRVYVGGTFTQIDGQPRSNLAAINADGSLSSWNPEVTGNTSGTTGVHAIAISGSTIYIGGNFASVGGQPRSNLAAVGLDGTVTAWNPIAAGSYGVFSSVVEALAVAGGTVYVGGSFSNIGGQTRYGLAAVDANGLVTSWNPNSRDGFSNYSIVKALAVSGSTVYVGGSFTKLGSLPRNGLAAVYTSGTITNWDPIVSGGPGQSSPLIDDFTVDTLAVSDLTVYIGGEFASVDGLSRSNLAAVTATGTVTSWNPGASGPVYSLAVDSGDVLAAGSFTSAGGEVRHNCAALDSNGQLTEWNPGVIHSEESSLSFTEASVTSLLVSDGRVYCGGTFNRVAGQLRNNLAALTTNGSLTTWNPDVLGADDVYGGGFGAPTTGVKTLAIRDGKVFFGGSFSTVGGQPRNNLAAVSVDGMGSTTAWNPNVTASANAYEGACVNALAVSGDTVYVGGRFDAVGWLPRQSLAAIDSSGVVTAWNPIASGGFGPDAGTVEALVVSDGIVYVSGSFSSVGGRNRNGLAAIDLNGLATSWNPAGDVIFSSLLTYPHALALSGDTVYIGGDVSGGYTQSPDGLAAVHVNGAILAWRPVLDEEGLAPFASVNALAVSDSAVYVGGCAGPYSSPSYYGTDDGIFAIFNLDGNVPPPSAPSNPGVVNATRSSLTWTWQDNSNNERGFRVYDDPGEGPPTTHRVTTDANTTYWTHIGLLANTQHAFQVSAINAGGESESTPNFTAWTGIETVAGITFSGVTSTTIGVAPSNTLSNLSAGQSGLLFENLTDGTNSDWRQSGSTWTSSELTPNTEYIFQVRSRNGGGDQTAPVRATKYTRAAVPMAPMVFAATDSTVNVAIGSGDGNPPQTSYALRLSPAVNGNIWLQANGSVGSSAVYNTANSWGVVTVRGLSENALYTVRALARNGAGENTEAGPGTSFATLSGAIPTVSLASVAPEFTNKIPVPFTATFSEPVTGFVASDINVINGTVSGFTGSGVKYTFNVVPSSQGVISVSVSRNVCVDSAGNPNEASNTVNKTYDSLAPNATLSSAASSPTPSTSIPVTVTFSESVIGFTSLDVTTTNGSVSNFGGSGTAYTFDLVPSGKGTVTASVPARTCTDLALNSNTASNVLSRTYDPGDDWQAENVLWRVDYGNNWSKSGVVTKPGATQIRLHFSAISTGLGDDHLLTNTGNDWSGQYSNQFSNEEVGNATSLTLTSDASGTGYFVIDRVEWKGTAAGPASKSGAIFGGECALKVKRPNGGQTWTIGSKQSIRWEAAGACSSYVRIELWRNGQKVRNIKKKTSNDGRAPWYIDPAGFLPNSNYKIRIVANDGSNLSDMTDGTFTLAPSFGKSSASNQSGGESATGVSPLRNLDEFSSPSSNVHSREVTAQSFAVAFRPTSDKLAGLSSIWATPTAGRTNTDGNALMFVSGWAGEWDRTFVSGNPGNHRSVSTMSGLASSSQPTR